MAYLDNYRLHTLPVDNRITPAQPSAILFSHGPDWTLRYQINRRMNYLDDRFMYKDQGPPMYRKLGAHFNMYKIPNKSDHSTYAKSYHYEPRQCNAPSYKNDAISFPPGPPPPQVAMFDETSVSTNRPARYQSLQIPNIGSPSLKAYDKYRYLPGPPPDTQLFGASHAFGALPRLA